MKHSLSPLQYSNLRAYFIDLFASGREKNARLTQSVFARQLRCSPATWNNFIQGRREISAKKLITFAKRLRWTAEELSHAMSLRALADRPDTTGYAAEVAILASSRSASAERRRIPAESFSADLDLISIALLQCARIPEFAGDPARIGPRLGFSVAFAQRSLDRLVAAGFLKRDTDGIYRRTVREMVFFAENRSQRLRSFYRQMLDTAAKRIRPETTERRYLGSETFAFDPANLPEARAIVNRCLDDLAALAVRCEKPRTIYHAGIQLFEILEDSA